MNEDSQGEVTWNPKMELTVDLSGKIRSTNPQKLVLIP